LPPGPGSGEVIRRGLHTRLLGQEIYGYETIPSTNHAALNLGEKGAPDGTLVIADFQSAGKGRFGRSWVAPAGTSLLLSLLLRPRLPVSDSFYLAMVAALGVAEGVERTTGLAARLKWPNDVLVAGRKVSGLLVESRILGNRLEFVVVGIGINVNLRTDGVAGIPAEATSLQTALGREVSRLALLQATLESIEQRYVGLHEGRSPRAEWSALLDTIGRRVRVQLRDRLEEGLAVDVNEAGALRIRRSDDQVLQVNAGDVLHLDQDS
jgi:BirA family biotin operon repressor/biotin-[acetyl-CoA-carboxylase] ligase